MDDVIMWENMRSDIISVFPGIVATIIAVLFLGAMFLTWLTRRVPTKPLMAFAFMVLGLVSLVGLGIALRLSMVDLAIGAIVLPSAVWLGNKLDKRRSARVHESSFKRWAQRVKARDNSNTVSVNGRNRNGYEPEYPLERWLPPVQRRFGV